MMAPPLFSDVRFRHHSTQVSFFVQALHHVGTRIFVHHHSGQLEFMLSTICFVEYSDSYGTVRVLAWQHMHQVNGGCGMVVMGIDDLFFTFAIFGTPVQISPITVYTADMQHEIIKFHK